MEFKIEGCLSFIRFLKLDFIDTVPDAQTLWLFRDRLVNKNAIDKKGEVPEDSQEQPRKLQQKDRIRMLVGI